MLEGARCLTCESGARDSSRRARGPYDRPTRRVGEQDATRLEFYCAESAGPGSDGSPPGTWNDDVSS
jgi:hypothetical protein